MNFSWLICALVPLLALETSLLTAQGRVDVQKPEVFRDTFVLNLKAEQAKGQLFVPWSEALAQSLAIQRVWIEFPLSGTKLPLNKPKAQGGGRIQFDDPSRSRLFQGLEARILLELRPVKGLYILPLAAVGGYSSVASFVYVWREQKFAKIPLVLVQPRGSRILVIADLQEADRIVVKGLHKIFAQRELTPREVKP